MVPWCRSIILSAIDKPRPFPLVLVVTIGKNTVCFICSGISGPLFGLLLTLLVTNMGSLMSIKELVQQWKTIVIGLAGILDNIYEGKMPLCDRKICHESVEKYSEEVYFSRLKNIFDFLLKRG